MSKNIWFCKIGEKFEGELPSGADWPMRKAVQDAYFALTGTEAEFVFSGWGGELTEGERKSADNERYYK